MHIYDFQPPMCVLAQYWPWFGPILGQSLFFKLSLRNSHQLWPVGQHERIKTHIYDFWPPLLFWPNIGPKMHIRDQISQIWVDIRSWLSKDYVWCKFGKDILKSKLWANFGQFRPNIGPILAQYWAQKNGGENLSWYSFMLAIGLC